MPCPHCRSAHSSALGRTFDSCLRYRPAEVVKLADTQSCRRLAASLVAPAVGGVIVEAAGWRWAYHATALPVVSERLGHRDKTSTANLYAHALPNPQRAAARDLDACISGHRDDPGVTQTPSAGGSQQVWDGPLERKTGFEPVTLSLARRCSTTEPLPPGGTGPPNILARAAVTRGPVVRASTSGSDWRLATDFPSS